GGPRRARRPAAARAADQRGDLYRPGRDGRRGPGRSPGAQGAVAVAVQLPRGAAAGDGDGRRGPFRDGGGPVPGARGAAARRGDDVLGGGGPGARGGLPEAAVRAAPGGRGAGAEGAVEQGDAAVGVRGAAAAGAGGVGRVRGGRRREGPVAG